MFTRAQQTHIARNLIETTASTIAEAWSPWRSCAVHHLWQIAADTAIDRSPT